MSLLDIIPDIAVYIAPDYLSNLALRMTCKLYYNTIPSINLHPFDISWIQLTRKKCEHNKCKSITYIERVIRNLSIYMGDANACAKHVLQNLHRKNNKIKFDHILDNGPTSYYWLLLGKHNPDLFWWLMHLGVLPLHQDEVADKSYEHSIMDYMFESNVVCEYADSSVVVPYVPTILEKYIKRISPDSFAYGDHLIELRINEYKGLKEYLCDDMFADVPFIKSIYHLWDTYDPEGLQPLWHMCGLALRRHIRDNIYSDVPDYMEEDDIMSKIEL